MLWTSKVGPSPMTLAACIFFALPIIVYFRIPSDHPFSVKLAALAKSTPEPILPLQDNATLVEQDYLFDNALEGGPRIRQASMLFGGGEKGEDAMYERSMKTHLEHGERWGYPSHILRQDLIGKGDWKVLVFGKLLYLLSIIVQEMSRPYGKRAEWLVWVDADTIILNQNIPWEAFLPPSDTFPGVNFLGNKDWNGYNCGVFFLRINEWSVNFLSEASALPLLRPDVELGTKAPNYEQDAMVWVLAKDEYRKQVVYQPREWYNPFEEGPAHQSESKPGDLLVHFPGMQGKHAAMGRWLDRIDHSRSELEIPVSNLTLRADITDFWTRLNNAQVQLQRASTLQEQDSTKRLFMQNPALGDNFTHTANLLRNVYEETPYYKKQMQEAQHRLEEALAMVSKAEKLAEEAKKKKKQQAVDAAKQKAAKAASQTAKGEIATDRVLSSESGSLPTGMASGDSETDRDTETSEETMENEYTAANGEIDVSATKVSEMLAEEARMRQQKAKVKVEQALDKGKNSHSASAPPDVTSEDAELEQEMEQEEQE